MGGVYYAPTLLIQGDVNNLATIGDAAMGNSRIRRSGDVLGFEDLSDNDFDDLILTVNSVEAVAS
jgi:hypothetical protein